MEAEKKATYLNLESLALAPIPPTCMRCDEEPATKKSGFDIILKGAQQKKRE